MSLEHRLCLDFEMLLSELPAADAETMLCVEIERVLPEFASVALE